MVNVVTKGCAHAGCNVRGPVWGKFDKNGSPARGKRYCYEHHKDEAGLVNIAVRMCEVTIERLASLAEEAAATMDTLPCEQKELIVANIVAWVREVTQMFPHAAVYVCVSHSLRALVEIGNTPFTSQHFVDKSGKKQTNADLSLSKAIKLHGAKQVVLAVTVTPEDANGIERAVQEALHDELEPGLGADGKPRAHRLWRRPGAGGTRKPVRIADLACVRYIVGALVIPGGDPPGTAFTLSEASADRQNAEDRAKANVGMQVQGSELPLPKLVFLPTGTHVQPSGSVQFQDPASGNVARKRLMADAEQLQAMYKNMLTFRALAGEKAVKAKSDEAGEEVDEAGDEVDMDMETLFEVALEETRMGEETTAEEMGIDIGMLQPAEEGDSDEEDNEDGQSDSDGEGDAEQRA